MFFFLPIGVEGFKVRIPVVSVVIAAMCFLAFFLTWAGNPERDGSINRDEVNRAVKGLEEHPYLKIPDSFGKQFLTQKQRKGVEAMREEWLKSHAPPDAEVIAFEQRELDAHFTAALAPLEKSAMRKWAFVPARGLLQPGLVTHMFLHFGWMHLLGNLLFFALCAPMLEDAWGRSLFGVFYLLGGLAAVLAHYLLDRHSGASMAGASGAIAACMGAFAVRFATRRVLIAYFIFVGFRFWRGVWRWAAWVCGVLWFGNQLLDFAIGGSTGVAVMAHIGGFAFGAVVSLGMKAIGLEKDLIGTSELDESPLQQSYSREAVLGIAALQQGDTQTARKRFAEVAATDEDAALGLVRLDFDEQRTADALRGLDLLFQRLLRTKSEARAVTVLHEMWPRMNVGDFRPPTAAALARLVDHEHTYQLAMPLYSRGGDAPGFVGIKSAIRALELYVGQRDGEGANAVLRKLDARTDQGQLATQIEALRPEVSRLLTMHVAPDSIELPPAEEPRFEERVTPVHRAPEVTRCSLTALNDEGLVVQLSAERFETVHWLTIVAIAAGVVPRPVESGRTGGVLLVDVVVAWANELKGPLCFRFDSDTTSMGTLFPAPTAGESYRAFLSRVFERADAVALPDLSTLTQGAFPRYPSVAERDAALFIKA